MTKYQRRIRSLLTLHERRVLARLKSPQQVQTYLDALPINFERDGETYMSPRRVMREKTAHCIEGALFGALALAYHGQKPLLLDFVTIPEDECHVVSLFKQNGYWGALSKTNHSVLRYRDPIYRTVRELALSYAHEYLMWSGKKSLRMYSLPFDLSRFAPEKWVIAEVELDWLVEKIDSSRHFPIAPPKNILLMRKASKIELEAMKQTEWRSPKPKADKNVT